MRERCQSAKAFPSNSQYGRAITLKHIDAVKQMCIYIHNVSKVTWLSKNFSVEEMMSFNIEQTITSVVGIRSRRMEL